MAKPTERRPVGREEREPATVITLRIPISLYQRLRAERRALDTSMNQVAIRAIEEYLARRKE